MSLIERHKKKLAGKWQMRFLLPAIALLIVWEVMIFGVVVPTASDIAMECKRETIRIGVQTAISVLQSYHEREKSGQISLKDAQQRAAALIEKTRFGPEGKDYYWINDMQPRMIMHPYRSDLNGRDLSGFMDPEGNHPFLDFVDVVRKQDAGYVQYLWQWKDESDRIVPKLSYVAGFEPWGWVVGTGVYLDDVEEKIAEFTNKLIAISLGILGFIAVLAWWIVFQGKASEELRTEAEDALAMSNERFRQIVENANDLIYVLDKNGVFLYASPKWQESLGYSSEEIEFRPFMPLVHPDDLPLCLEFLKKVDETRQPQRGVEYRVLHKNGHWQWHTTNASVLDDDPENPIFLGIGHDITQRKEVERELRVERDFAANIFHATGALVLVLDDEGRILRFNRSCEILTGLSYDEVRETHPWDMFIGQKYRSVAIGLFRSMTNGKDMEQSEYPWRDSKGEDVVIAWSSSAHRKPDGSLNYIIQVGVDISDLKRMQQQNDSLQRRLHQSQKMDALGTLAGGIAHDFNNILGVIIGSSQMALEEIPEEHLVREDLEQILQASERAKNLVQQILAFSRRSRSDKMVIDVKHVFKEALDMLRASLPSTIEIHKSILAKRSTIFGNPTQIHQILINLATNAAHAMRNSGNHLEMLLESTEIDEQTEEPHVDKAGIGFLTITVRDNGEGIPEAIIGKIFDPFFTTKKKGEGTGLGLSVVHGIVKDHQGYIEIDSIAGEGTTVKISFPLSEDTEKEQPEKTEQILEGRGRVLCVDDEPNLLNILDRMMKNLGYQTSCYTNSYDALDAFSENPRSFDLLLTDQTMPLMTGIELSEKVLAIRPGFPIVITSGYYEKKTKRKARELGIRCFIEKPLDIVSLSVAVNEAIGNTETGVG